MPNCTSAGMQRRSRPLRVALATAAVLLSGAEVTETAVQSARELIGAGRR